MKNLRKPKTKQQKWYEGGTLHQAPIKVWHKETTTARNALATCCDFIHAAKELDNWALAPFKTQEEVYGLCVQLVQALIRGSKDHLEAVGEQRMADLAPIAMALLGWLKTNKISEEYNWLKESIKEREI